MAILVLDRASIVALLVGKMHKSAARPQVDDLGDASARIKHEIGWFQVTMRHIVLVEKLEMQSKYRYETGQSTVIVLGLKRVTLT